MNISVLLRLLREPLAAGRVVGQVEVVDTGERTLVQNEQELLAYLRERAQDGHGEDSEPGRNEGRGRVPPAVRRRETA